jgi:hypothetical protein
MELLDPERAIRSWGGSLNSEKCAPDDVRYLGQSVEHILHTSFTPRDPFRTKRGARAAWPVDPAVG